MELDDDISVLIYLHHIYDLFHFSFLFWTSMLDISSSDIKSFFVKSKLISFVH